MSKFHVYIIQSQRNPSRFYTGLAADPMERLKKHNEGGARHTRSGRPWRLRTVVSFDDETRARAFERYLKSGSGRAFAKKRL